MGGGSQTRDQPSFSNDRRGVLLAVILLNPSMDHVRFDDRGVVRSAGQRNYRFIRLRKWSAP